MSYDGYVINDGRVYLTGGSFDEFSLQKGRVRGKESLEHYDGSEVGIAPGDQRRFTYKYSVAFEATPQGKPTFKEFEGAAAPNIPYRLSKQGTADGSLTFDDNTIELKYAYALRRREFFDEPEVKFGGEDAGKGMLILALFLLAGLLPLYFLIRLVRMAAAFEKRAELLLPHWSLEPGDEVEMSFQCNLKKALTAMSVDVTLECQKVDRSGSETRTTIEDTRSRSVRDFKQQDKRVTGKWQLGMPGTWTLPYKRETEELGWKVNVVVELAEGPKGVFNFPLLVVPKHEVEDDHDNSELTQAG